MKPSSEIKDPVRSIRAPNGRTSPPKSIYINPMPSSDCRPHLKQMPTDAPSVVDPGGHPGALSRDLSPEHSADALGKAPATVEIRYLATFRDQARQIVSW